MKKILLSLMLSVLAISGAWADDYYVSYDPKSELICTQNYNFT